MIFKPNSGSADLSQVTNVLGITHGGMGITTWTAGQIIYAASSSSLGRIAIGATNQILTSSGATPYWSNVAIESVPATFQPASLDFGGMGTVSSFFGFYTIRNKTLNCWGSFQMGTAGATYYFLKTPDAYTINSNYYGISVATSVGIVSNRAAYNKPMHAVYDPSIARLLIGFGTVGSGILDPVAGNTELGSNTIVGFNFTVQVN